MAAVGADDRVPEAMAITGATARPVQAGLTLPRTQPTTTPARLRRQERPVGAAERRNQSWTELSSPPTRRMHMQPGKCNGNCFGMPTQPLPRMHRLHRTYLALSPSSSRSAVVAAPPPPFGMGDARFGPLGSQTFPSFVHTVSRQPCLFILLATIGPAAAFFPRAARPTVRCLKRAVRWPQGPAHHRQRPSSPPIRGRVPAARKQRHAPGPGAYYRWDSQVWQAGDDDMLRFLATAGAAEHLPAFWEHRCVRAASLTRPGALTLPLLGRCSWQLGALPFSRSHLESPAQPASAGLLRQVLCGE